MSCIKVLGEVMGNWSNGDSGTSDCPVPEAHHHLRPFPLLHWGSVLHGKNFLHATWRPPGMSMRLRSPCYWKKKIQHITARYKILLFNVSGSSKNHGSQATFLQWSNDQWPKLFPTRSPRYPVCFPKTSAAGPVSLNGHSLHWLSRRWLTGLSGVFGIFFCGKCFTTSFLMSYEPQKQHPGGPRSFITRVNEASLSFWDQY